MTSDDPTPDDPADPITVETAKEVLRLSELYLDGTLKLMIAADTRAMQIAGLSSAAATALSIFGFNYIVHPSRIDFSLGVSAFGAGVAFYAALFFALWAAQPRDFNVGGNIYTRWSQAELKGPLVGPLLTQARDYDDKIRENINILSENTTRIKRSLKLIAGAPICAITTGAIAYYAWSLITPPVPSA